MDIPIGAHHLFEIAAIIDVQQRDDVRISISDMAEDRHRHLLSLEEFFQVSDQLADAPGRHDNIIHKIDGLLPRIESIESRIECLPRFPELLPTFGIERQRKLRRQLIRPTDGSHGFSLLTEIVLGGISIQLDQQRRRRIGRNAMLPSADQVERIGIHDFQGTGLEGQELRYGVADFFQILEMDKRGQRGLGLVHQREPGFTHHTQRPLAADE